MDKLAMEEAGFRNCVSVPDGAPAKVSNNDLPDAEKVCAFLTLVMGSHSVHVFQS